MTEPDARRIALAGCCAPPTAETARYGPAGRRIGPWGTAARAVSGIALLVSGFAFDHGHPWLGVPGAGSRGWGLLGGLLILPSLLTVALRVRGRAAAPLRVDAAGVGIAVVATLFVLWQIVPVAMFTFIGASLLLLAARGENGCEVLAISNWVLRRRDYVFCAPFTPLDRWEARRRAERREELRPSRPGAVIRAD